MEEKQKCGAVSKTYQGIEAHELVRQLPRGNGHTARGPPRRHPALFFCLQKEYENWEICE